MRSCLALPHFAAVIPGPVRFFSEVRIGGQVDVKPTPILVQLGAIAATELNKEHKKKATQRQVKKTTYLLRQRRRDLFPSLNHV